MAWILGLVDQKELKALTSSEKMEEVEILSDEKLTGLFGEGWDQDHTPGDTYVMIPVDVNVGQIMFGADWNAIFAHSGEDESA